MKHDEVQAKIQEIKKERGRRCEITQDRVLLEYARLAFFDPRKLFDDEGNPKDVSALDDDTAAALAGLDVVKEIDPDSGVTSYTKKYKVANKLGALDSLAKHLGLLNGQKDNQAAADGQETGVAMLPPIMERPDPPEEDDDG